MRLFPFFTRGSMCPRCGRHTDRVHTPLLLRPVRLAYPEAKRRFCTGPDCAWRGFALPGRTNAAGPSMPLTPR